MKIGRDIWRHVEAGEDGNTQEKKCGRKRKKKRQEETKGNMSRSKEIEGDRKVQDETCGHRRRREETEKYMFRRKEIDGDGKRQEALFTDGR